MEHNDEPMENPQEVISECLSKFCTSDYIMEPGIFTQLKRYDLMTAILMRKSLPSQLVVLFDRYFHCFES